MNRPYSHHKRAADWSFKEDYPRVDSALSNLGLRNPVDLVTPLGVLLGGAGGYGLYRLLAHRKNRHWTTGLLATLVGAKMLGFAGDELEGEIRRREDLRHSAAKREQAGQASENETIQAQ
jgi:hypothetical protein